MLKFIRKYQLIILAIGGSLLMVVFLFQPIIGKLSPDPRKAPVAKLSDGSSFNGFDFQRASFDLAVLKRVYPRVFAPLDQGGLGLDSSAEESSERHWLLLSHQAKAAGLIGEAGEGRTWIPYLAQREATAMVQQQIQQGAITSPQQAQQMITDMSAQFETELNRRVSLATGMARGMTEDEVFRTLASARGIERLYRVFTSIPSYSDIGAMQAAKSRFDRIAVDAAVIRADQFADSIPLPSESELQAFFEQYKADAPSDNEYAIGYAQPPRAKMGWITLNKQLIESTIEIDRVELNKTWRADHKLPEGSRKYPGDFAGERANIERAYRTDRALDIMIEADKIIRSQVLQATRGLHKKGSFLVLPDDWNTKTPTLEAIAQAVVDGLNEQLSVRVPLPTVEIHTDRWLNIQDIAAMPGFGTATYRIGQAQLPTYLLPQAVDTEEASDLITVQTRVPIVDPAAEDAMGNRYYALVYETLPQGPSQSIDDAGRDRVVRDFRTIKAFEMLRDNADEIIAQAKATNDLAPAIDAALALGSGSITRPGVSRNLLVSKENIARGRLASSVPQGLNTETFRNAVWEASADLDQMTPPEAVAQNPRVIATPLPSTKSLGLAKIIAPRPLTIDAFNAEMTGLLSDESQNQIRDALNEAGSSPFALDTLSKRYGYTRVKKRNGQDDQDLPIDGASDEESESDS